MIDPHDLRTLRFFQEIEGNAELSQRFLARRLNVSLGLVNSFLKRLVRKGFCKVASLPRNRVRYVLTPRGMAEKTRLTYKYIQHSLDLYALARSQMADLFAQLDDRGVRRVVFLGTGSLAEIAFLSLQETRIHLVAVVDPQRAGKRFFTHTVIGLDGLGAIACDRFVVTTREPDLLLFQCLARVSVPCERLIVPRICANRWSSNRFDNGTPTDRPS